MKRNMKYRDRDTAQRLKNHYALASANEKEHRAVHHMVVQKPFARPGSYPAVSEPGLEHSV